jgi:hypothetical protein
LITNFYKIEYYEKDFISGFKKAPGINGKHRSIIQELCPEKSLSGRLAQGLGQRTGNFKTAVKVYSDV